MRLILLLAILGLAAACTPDYPFDKRGTWSLDNRPNANDLNLRTMITNPQDLTEGAGDASSLGSEASQPIDRLLKGRRAPLPVSDLTQLQLNGAASPPTPQGNNQ
jgi:hypothetical protein